MDTLYYRKIAEIMKRDEDNIELREIALRVLALGRDKHDNVRSADRKKLRAWLLQWCDNKER